MSLQVDVMFSDAGVAAIHTESLKVDVSFPGAEKCLILVMTRLKN